MEYCTYKFTFPFLNVLSLFQVDFELYVKWPEYSYLYLYAMFYKAEILKNDHNFFRPVSQLKTSVIVWYLLSSEPPSHSVSHLTPSQAKSIWGLTDKCLETHYEESQEGEHITSKMLLGNNTQLNYRIKATSDFKHHFCFISKISSYTVTCIHGAFACCKNS